jgi:very-short-patch-repair endonuclease
LADFYCPAAKLAVEVDGNVHEGQQEADRQRQEEIERLGIILLRFTNEEVLNGPQDVLTRIAAALG